MEFRRSSPKPLSRPGSSNSYLAPRSPYSPSRPSSSTPPLSRPGTAGTPRSPFAPSSKPIITERRFPLSGTPSPRGLRLDEHRVSQLMSSLGGSDDLRSQLILLKKEVEVLEAQNNSLSQNLEAALSTNSKLLFQPSQPLIETERMLSLQTRNQRRFNTDSLLQETVISESRELFEKADAERCDLKNQLEQFIRENEGLRAEKLKLNETILNMQQHVAEASETDFEIRDDRDRLK
jgi:hypothetical protein